MSDPTAIALMPLALAHAHRRVPPEQLAFYVTQLREYPADIVHEAAIRCTREIKWFPAIPDLLERILEIMAERRRSEQPVEEEHTPSGDGMPDWARAELEARGILKRRAS